MATRVAAAFDRLVSASLGRRRDSASSTGLESRYGSGWEAYQHLIRFNGNQYTVNGSYSGYQNRYLMRACGPVFTVMDRRISVLGEARPTFQRFVKGRPDELFSSRDLEILKRPWPGGTWRHLVAACEVDDAGAGNSYWIRPGAFGIPADAWGDRLIRLNPDWITIVTESYMHDGVELGEELLGYIVQKPGHQGKVLYPEQVAHYRPGAPVECPFRGESWLASVVADSSADIEMTAYKGNYLKNGAMPSLAVTYEPTLSQEALEAFVPVFAEKFTGAMNAGKILHFLGGRDVKTVGATLDQLAFKAVQGAGETRIAAAAGVPAVVAAFSEGMQGSSLNSGNYSATRRLYADSKIRPLLGSLCDAFATLVPPPADSRLSYDDSGVSFFQEDVADEANIRQTTAMLIRSLIEAGFHPDAAVAYGKTGRLDSLVGQHSGLTSVQLTPPGTEPPSLEGGNDDGSQD